MRVKDFVLPAHVAAWAVFTLSSSLWSAEAQVVNRQPPAQSPATSPAPLRAWSLSTAGTLLAASNELPTASGERLAQTTGEVPAQMAGGVVLIDGDVLVGKVVSMQAGNTSLSSGAFGMVTIPAERLAAILVTNAATSLPYVVPPAFCGALLSNGERISGQPAFLNATQAGIDNGKRVVQIPRERVAALVLRPQIPANKPVVRLRLLSGDLVSGTLTAGSDGTWNLRHACGAWSIPQVQVGGWWTESEQRLPLSSLVPVASYADDLEPPLLPLQRDQAGDGSWLRLGAVRADRGLLARAGTTATFALNGTWKSWVAVVGIAHGGPAVVRVSGDQQTLWESPPLSAGAAPQPLLVPLTGVKSLHINVIAQADKTVPAYAVFGWAFLVK